MDDRKAAILRAVIEEYIATAQPVASSSITRTAGLGVSSATVRNEMNELEREGYLAQPHTSAGRVPTDLGYRFYVDQMRAPGRLATREEQAVSHFFRDTHHALEDMLHETSQLLVRLTDHASVVVGPQPDAATVRSVQLVELKAGVVLLVAVLSTGAVEKVTLMVPEALASQGAIARASAALNDALVGHSPGSLPAPGPTGIAEADTLADTAYRALAEVSRTPESSVMVAGKGKLASESFDTNDQAVRLLELLEQQVVVVTMVRNVLDAGLSVRIGTENELEELQNCSLVLARYAGADNISGMVGVLGPTRMDYKRALAAVSVVSDQLGQSLTR
jgi:heat-inducible transcriptional repressor